MKETIRRVMGYLAPYRGQLALGSACALCYVLFTLLGPVFIGRAVDCVLGPGEVDYRGVAFWLALLAASVLLASAFQWVTNVATRKISAWAANDMRREAFARINRVPLRYIDGHAHGDIVSRMVNDAEFVSEGILQALTQLLPGVATILGTLVIMAALNFAIAMVVVVVTPASIWFAGFVAKRTSHFFKAQSDAQGQLSGFVNEMVAGQDVVRAFGYEERCFARFDAISDEVYDTGLKSIFYSSITNPGTRFVNAIVYAAVVVFGAIAAVMGAISVGQLSSFLTYANQYTKPFNEVTGVITQLQSAVASAERLFAVIDAEPETPDAPGAKAPAGCEGAVDVEHVHFSYTPKVPLIEDFNLRVRPGQRIAIVGPTGCGKTTLINLLMRFYDVQKGAIRVDGVPVQDMKRSALRGLYGMVLQETWLKNATVRENIAYGRPDAPEEEIVAAARAAYAHSFIKRLPNGYDTVIAPGGGNLSAGQKQLLCIARIMLCQPDMLILDEATSSIDTRTEMLVQRAFEALMAGRTSFVVAHRLSTIQTADQILVMNAGHIVEQGTHEQLLAQGGFYAKLYYSQFAPV
ncbi:MAG TPA: ABC transporter ATP-binding protein/permease [Candidatus Ruthenibacterium merdigallinarum]|nr:ABC transporter ATP-binding protein/permease [Candidatus Ruthenibacterium merdigallinarum]